MKSYFHKSVRTSALFENEAIFRKKITCHDHILLIFQNKNSEKVKFSESQLIGPKGIR